MKKIVLLFTVMLMSGLVAKAQWTFTPEAGMNVTKYENSDNAKIGARLGVAVEYQLPQSELFSIKSGLYFVQRRSSRTYFNSYYYSYGYGYGGYGSIHGAIYDAGSYVYGEYDSSQSYLSSAETNKNYLQLPVLANFRWNICNDVKLTAGVGPYIAYGVGGKSRSVSFNGKGQTSTFEQGSFSDMEIIGSDGTNYYRPGDKRFDWGVTAIAGIEIKRVSVSIGYDMGLGKQYSGYSYQVSPQYHTVSLTVGYSF